MPRRLAERNYTALGAGNIPWFRSTSRAPERYSGMTSTPTPRPDVAGIKARSNQRLSDGICFTTLEAEQERNNLALCLYIEALEERMGKLEEVVKAARKVRNDADDLGWWVDELETALAALASPDEQKAMEAGDG